MNRLSQLGPDAFCFEVSGSQALFSDPIMRVSGQKCSYPVPTYEALKGICKSVYFKPTFIIFVDAVRIMNPIRMTACGVKPVHYQDASNDLAYYMYLSDVRYQVFGHIEWNMNRPEFAGDRILAKHIKMMRNAIRAGGRRNVFLGTSECCAEVDACDFGAGDGYYDNTGEMQLDLMLHSITYPEEAYSDATRGQMMVAMWRPVMRNGVIEFIRPDQCTMTKPAGRMAMQTFVSKKGGAS